MGLREIQNIYFKENITMPELLEGLIKEDPSITDGTIRECLDWAGDTDISVSWIRK